MSPVADSLADLRAAFASREPTAAELAALKADPRAGAQALVRTIQARRKKEAAESRRLFERLKYERPLWESGIEHVAGCDEAGVGPLAGPVVAGAVILRPNERIRGVDDSKVLPEHRRNELAQEIRARAVSWAIGIATPAEIDQLNVYRAGLLAMRRALDGLNPRPGHVLLDARKVPGYPVPQTPIIKGDAKSLTIGAASILAKTHRDALMVELDARFPCYGFARHKGYPVPEHFEALNRLGPCAEHRKSYAPVREAMGLMPRQEPMIFRSA